MSGHLRIIRGDATPEEIAALVAVLAARGPAPEPPPAAPRTQTWRNPARQMRKPLSSGKAAWRTSALP
ncbi:acyl-CoA carboxylase epsilon subunit [Nonomuraea lactucae]|uniref:acyl-CoA carboxylase epsilon subunit n=1 Tax=Nonomuraea lactucae TaxID=2249762 RepID=UPI000DE1CA53|nr:acyl-CoA carboxylase epsilon subunit [Nonomuraea lactucae]